MASELAILLFWIAQILATGTNQSLDRLAITQALGAPLTSLQDNSTTPTLRQAADKRGILIGSATEAIPLLREPAFATLTANQFLSLIHI